MSTTTMNPRSVNEPAVGHFLTGLKNVHAVENQALALIDRQLDRLTNYPQVSERLHQHRLETEKQIERVETILGTYGEKHSSLKDAAMTVVGNLAALGHTPAGDEILKNSFANLAFENYEAASYISLITMAEAAGEQQALDLLNASLSEEERMATWIRESLPDITRRYLLLDASGEKASR